MKTKFKDRANPNDPLSQQAEKAAGDDLFLTSKVNTSQNTPQLSSRDNDLMNRLINGKKAKVSQADMKKLTSKNYENLPEIKKKKEEKIKKEQEAERRRKIAEQ